MKEDERKSRVDRKGDLGSGHFWADLIAFIQMDVNLKNYKDGKHTLEKNEVRTSLHCFKYTTFSQRPLEAHNGRVMTTTRISSKVSKGIIKWDRKHDKAN